MASAIITNAFIWHFVALQRRFIVGYQPVLVNSAAGWWVSLFGWLWAEPLTEKALTEKPVTETSGNRQHPLCSLATPTPRPYHPLWLELSTTDLSKTALSTATYNSNN